MKLLPKNKKTKKEYPTLKEYRESKRKSKTNLIMATTFSMTLSLTPFLLTSCNSKVSEKKVEKKVKVEKKIEKIDKQIDKPDQILGKRDLSNDKNFKDSTGKVVKPQALDGVVGSFKDNPCDTDIKDTKKDVKDKDTKKNKDIKEDDNYKIDDSHLVEKILRPRTRGVMIKSKKDEKIEKVKKPKVIKKPEVIKKPRILKGKRVAPKRDDK